MQNFFFENQLLLEISSFDAHVYKFCYRCDSLESLRRRLPSVEQELSNQTKFRDLYQFTYRLLEYCIKRTIQVS